MAFSAAWFQTMTAFGWPVGGAGGVIVRVKLLVLPAASVAWAVKVLSPDARRHVSGNWNVPVLLDDRSGARCPTRATVDTGVGLADQGHAAPPSVMGSAAVPVWRSGERWKTGEAGGLVCRVNEIRGGSIRVAGRVGGLEAQTVEARRRYRSIPGRSRS